MTTGPSVFGTMWRRSIAAGETPSAMAACTYSCRLIESVWPRTMRAMSSHSTAPTAMNIRTKFRPKKTTSRMTKKMKGSE